MFQVGDKVKSIDDVVPWLTKNKVYEVLGYYEPNMTYAIYVFDDQGNMSSFNDNRFVLASITVSAGTATGSGSFSANNPIPVTIKNVPKFKAGDIVYRKNKKYIKVRVDGICTKASNCYDTFVLTVNPDGSGGGYKWDGFIDVIDIDYELLIPSTSTKIDLSSGKAPVKQLKPCTCDSLELMRKGCMCNSIEKRQWGLR